MQRSHETSEHILTAFVYLLRVNSWLLSILPRKKPFRGLSRLVDWWIVVMVAIRAANWSPHVWSHSQISFICFFRVNQSSKTFLTLPPHLLDYCIVGVVCFRRTIKIVRYWTPATMDVRNERPHQVASKACSMSGMLESRCQWRVAGFGRD